MDVAVAEMAEVHHWEFMFGAELAGVRDQLGNTITRDHHVLVHLADLHLGDCRAHRLTRGPETLGLTGLYDRFAGRIFSASEVANAYRSVDAPATSSTSSVSTP